ncbi:MAG: hypothetical protein O2856_06835 [Planctomycetota bacterium]|nr:hypothetical protein [Planctomycetota bacterium]
MLQLVSESVTDIFVASSEHQMHFKTIFNRVTDYKPFVVDHIHLVEHASKPVIEVTMRARGNGAPECSESGRRCPGYDTMPTARRFDFIPVWMIPVGY